MPTRRVARAAMAALSVTAVTVVGAPAATAHAASASDVAAAAYARMSVAQRVGQLFMAGVPVSGASSTTRATLSAYHVGNVILMGASTAGVAGVRTVVTSVRAATTQSRTSPYVAVDQEGGYVQHLKGSGFSTIPTALAQGQLSTTTLRADWSRWATQLRNAGINLDLAPVADIVPASVGTSNQPIGRYYREYGHTTSVVDPHVTAVVNGIHASGLSASAKHFPGLGRATGNTDTAAHVTDPTTRTDPYLAAFRATIAAGVPMMMVSTAIYPNIDGSTVAAFSHLVTTVMLRHDLGFGGVIISDSLQAQSVSGYSYTTRAIRALDAGVDILLLTDTSPIGSMTSAIRARMSSDSAFATVVKQAVMRVLTAKAKAGLISS